MDRIVRTRSGMTEPSDKTPVSKEENSEHEPSMGTSSLDELQAIAHEVHHAEWFSLASSWKDEASLESLFDYVVAEHRKVWGAFLGEALASLLVLVVWGYLWTQKLIGRPPLHAIGVICVLFVLVWVGRYYHNVRPLWSKPKREREPLLRFVKARLEARIAWLNFYQQAMVILAIVLALWTPWMFWTFRNAYMSQPWRALVGFGGWIAILGGVYWFVNARKKETQEQLKIFEKLYGDALKQEP